MDDGAGGELEKKRNQIAFGNKSFNFWQLDN